MKRKTLLFLLVFLTLSCGNTSDDVNELIRKDYLSNYRLMLNYYEINNESVKKKFNEYFKGKEYKVIWAWDIDGDGMKEYLAIEEYPGVHRGFKRGVLVDERGKIRLYFDRNKGIYAPEYTVWDFKRTGIKPGDVECFRIGYSEHSEGKTIQDFDVQILDNDLYVINNRVSESAPYVGEIIEVDQNSKIEFSLIRLSLTEEQIYEDFRERIREFRLNKSAGKAWKYPEYEEDRKKLGK